MSGGCKCRPISVELNLKVGTNAIVSECHRRSQGGALGARAPPGRKKKNFFFFLGGGKFTGESCKCNPRGRKCTPEAEQESIF